MGKKVKEYKSGDFIFAKVKGYPAWPARVQRPNGKKYFVYFYGTGETANLPPNMIFDYAENKDKFLTKTVKRRDFNDGVKQIEYDFANNVPLEEVIGVPVEVHADVSTNDTANDSALDTTMDESAADTTANDTVAEDPNVTQTDAVVEDSDDAGPLVIDEGKTPSKSRKAKPDAKGKETPKPGKTPRGKAKKDEPKEKDKEDDKIDEEVVSRSGRKIRPKRYMDEQSEDSALSSPSPAPKRRRGSPIAVVEKQNLEAPKEKEAKNDKTFTEYNVVKQSELEGMKKPFEPTESADVQKCDQQITNQDVPKKIEPTFGKTSQNNETKKATKPKKFVPPTKSQVNPNVTTSEPILKNSRNNQNTLPSFDQTFGFNFKTQENMTENFFQENSISSQELEYSQDLTQVSAQTEIKRTKEYPQSQNTKRGKESVGGVIFGSLNLLNDTEFALDYLSQSQNSQYNQTDSQEFNQTQKSDRSVKNLSRHQSVCSVASLKIYKDLDYKSNENINFKPKIPNEEDFLNMFKDYVPSTGSNPVPMSLEYGDMGFNTKYSEYVKNVGCLEEFDVDANATYSKVLDMYPIENKRVKK